MCGHGGPNPLVQICTSRILEWPEVIVQQCSSPQRRVKAGTHAHRLSSRLMMEEIQLMSEMIKMFLGFSLFELSDPLLLKWKPFFSEKHEGKLGLLVLPSRKTNKKKKNLWFEHEKVFYLSLFYHSLPYISYQCTSSLLFFFRCITPYSLSLLSHPPNTPFSYPSSLQSASYPRRVVSSFPVPTGPLHGGAGSCWRDLWANSSAHPEPCQPGADGRHQWHRWGW